MNPKASCGVLYPPLRGIVQLTNSAALAELEFHNKIVFNFKKKPHRLQAVRLLALLSPPLIMFNFKPEFIMFFPQ